MTAEHPECQTCGTKNLDEIAGFRTLPRVTSDSKAFRPGGRLFVCAHCGMVQKRVDAEWLNEIGEIYRDYDMYHQSAANDQPVFDPLSGSPRGRCEILAGHLRTSGALPESGALLDVGAGSGAMLAAFSSASEEWRLFGSDLDARKERALSQIPRFETLFTAPLDQLSEQFDLITLIHSLEHFTDPLAMLRAVRDRCEPGGKVFIQVNNVARMPFDLIVADHLCHFTPRTLSHLVERAGFDIEILSTEWVNKEISLLAVRRPAAKPVSELSVQIDDITKAQVAWLERMLKHAHACSSAGQFGIFGTSVAATWLAAGLGDAVDFFVDEDPARRGRTHLGRTIFQPGDVPRNSVVYLAFVPGVARAIRQRLAAFPGVFVALDLNPDDIAPAH